MPKKSGVKKMVIQGGGKDVIILSTGVVLKLGTVPAWKMNDAVKVLEKPTIPKIMVDGDREIENPDDPEYQKAVKKYEEEVSFIFNDYMIVFGTSLVTKPDDLPGVEDTEWKEALEWSGTKVGASRMDVYLKWVKYVAGPKAEDIALIIKEVGRRSGVSESDVKTATDNFRSEGRPDSDN